MIVIAGPRRWARDPAIHAAHPNPRPVSMDRRVTPGGDEEMAGTVSSCMNATHLRPDAAGSNAPFIPA
jgi:hypothetical protein